MDTVLAWYREPLFLYFGVGTTLVALASLSVFAIPYTLLAYYDPASLRKYKVQTLNDRLSKEQRDSIVPSLQSLVFNYVLSFVVVVLSWPIVRVSGIHMRSIDDWGSFVGWGLLKVVGAIYMEDFTFYWMHRALHTKALYGRIHKMHHRFTAPVAINGAYMTATEQNLIVVGILLPMAVFRAHVYVVWAWMAFRNWETAEEHSGYDLPWNPSRLIPFYEGACYHDFHHAKYLGNYAAVTPLWDRLFGTVSEGYEEHLTKLRTKQHSR